VKRLILLLATATLACGGEEPAEEAGTNFGPDTLPASIEAPDVEEGFLIVSPEQVRAWEEAGEPFVLIDARDAVQYEREHIPGAINVPYVDIRAGANLPPKDSRIAIYCSDRDCPISRYAYETLRVLGYVNLYDMHEGIQGWKAAGYPTVIGEADPLAPAGSDTAEQV
jgi:rhodanese-related sulfurtransferase